MLFITNKHLKPGMILARDIYLYNHNNFNILLMSKGQSLNNAYIKKIIYHNISGVYIENEAFNDINVQPAINKKLEAKSLAEIKEVYSEFKKNTGKIKPSSIKKISATLDDLITEISNKKELAYNIIEFRNYDDYTYQHCLNVAALSISTGMSIGLGEHMLHDLGMAGFLHDIGKMLIPLEILNKHSELTKEEFEMMKTHPVIAVDMLKHVISNDVLRGIESHHEKLDGTGYPYGRTKENICLYGKILAVCDVYDALTSDRTYRKSCFPSEVVEYIMGCADTHFEYEIICKFLKNIVAYPVGTFVELSNGKLGVVTKNYSENIMRPVVRIINDDNSVGEDIDLLHDIQLMNVTITGMGYEYKNIDYNDITKTVG